MKTKVALVEELDEQKQISTRARKIAEQERIRADVETRRVVSLIQTEVELRNELDTTRQDIGIIRRRRDEIEIQRDEAMKVAGEFKELLEQFSTERAKLIERNDELEERVATYIEPETWIAEALALFQRQGQVALTIQQNFGQLAALGNELETLGE